MKTTQIADFFCELYDGYASDHATLLALPSLRPGTRRIKERVRDLVCEGRYEIVVARAAIEADATPATALGHMWGIDAAFERINPYRATDPPSAMKEGVARVAAEQRFSSEQIDGALIARSQTSGRPNQEDAVFADAFSALLRVSKDSWENTERIVLPLGSQLSLGELDGGLRVASAAVLEHPGELSWETEERNGIRYYRIAVLEADVRSRQSAIVRGLLARDCHVALMPELSCSPDLLTNWQNSLRDEFSAPSTLRWVLVGTGDLDDGPRPVNAGVLLDAATTDPLMRHDKMFAFTLTKQQLEDWQLPLPADHALDEDIVRGHRKYRDEPDRLWVGPPPLITR
jgi:hypothetical protein